MESAQKGNETSRKTAKIIAWTFGSIFAVLAVAYGALVFTVSGKAFKGTEVAGVDLSGLTAPQAEQRLKAELSKHVSAPISLTGNGLQVPFNPTEAGLNIDYGATVRQVTHSTWNPIELIQSLSTHSHKVNPVMEIDEAVLTKTISALAPKFDIKAKPASVEFQGIKIVRTAAVKGSTLKLPETVNRAKDAWQNLKHEVAAELVVVNPSVDTAAVDEVVSTYAQPAVSGPIVAKTAKGDITVTPEMIAKSTTFIAEGNKIVPKTSPEKLLAEMKPAIDALKLPAAKNASWSFTNGHPVVVPAVDGFSLGTAEVQKTILPAITATSRKVELTLAKVAPKLTTEAAQKLGIKEVTGEFVTYFPNTAYRNINLPRAAHALNGTVILPGETFSFNKVVGQRTTSNGYVAGGAICPNNKICNQMGGGVSQVATTTYNAFFYSGLKHITHQPHTLYFDRYPAGRESTIDWGHIDVSFYNDTPYAVYIEGIGIPGTGSRRGEVRIKIWSTKQYKVLSSELVKSNFVTPKTIVSTDPSCKPQGGMTGFDVNYERRWYKNGKLVKSEPYFWRYDKTDVIECAAPQPSS